MCPKLALTKHTNTAYTSHRYLPSILYRSLSQMGTGGRENYDIILRKRNLRERWQQQHYTVCVMSALSWVAVPRIWSPEGNTVCVTRVETRYHLEPKGVPKASIDETHQHCRTRCKPSCPNHPLALLPVISKLLQGTPACTPLIAATVQPHT